MTIKSLSPDKNKNSKQMFVHPKMEENFDIYDIEKREGTYTDSRSKNEQNELIIKQC